VPGGRRKKASGFDLQNFERPHDQETSVAVKLEGVFSRFGKRDVSQGEMDFDHRVGRPELDFPGTFEDSFLVEGTRANE
jgi:hypothetical protein